MPADTKVDELLNRLDELRRQGQEVAAEELCKDCPEHIEEVKQAVAELESIDAKLRTSDSEDSSRQPGRELPGKAWPTIPGYEVLGELGRGGMGVVYKARQVALNRLVALKLILVGARAGREQRSRFRTEAEAAARLQHPNVVQVYEVGEQDGCPFLCLELVEGGSLGGRLGGVPQPARAAAVLVEVLARAAHAAHQRGIVHRDLKPGNVLLTTDGTPKLTDFGLAKLLDAEAGQTGSHDVLGTPSYMAPEQAQGRTKEVGPWTDVYALGAILYELLTGRPPFRGESPADTLDQVRTQEPVPPRRLQPKVPRDLETASLKCLEKEPTRRYATAEALADDLRCFLDDKPIMARPVSPAGRLWRWCRRRPGLATLTAALVLAVIAGVAGVFFQWQRAEANAADARHRGEEAAANFRQARAVVDFLVEVSEQELRAVPGSQRARKKMLEKALGFYQDFVRRHGDDPGLQAELAVAHFRMGGIHSEFGSRDAAVTAYLNAREILERLTQNHPDDNRLWTDLALTENNLGGLWMDMGNLEKARASHQRAREIREKLIQKVPASAEFRSHLAFSHYNLGELARRLGKSDEALRDHDEARRIREELVKKYPANIAFQDDLAASYNVLAVLQRVAGRIPEALLWLEKATNVWEKVTADNPDLVKPRADLSVAYHNRGSILHARGELPKALESLNRALEIREGLVRENPRIPLFERDLAGTSYNIGLVHYDRKDFQAALRAHERARDLRKRLVDREPGHGDSLLKLAQSYNSLAIVEQDLHRPELGMDYLRRACEVLRQLVRDYPKIPVYRLQLAASLHNLGRFHVLNKRPDDALEPLKEAQEVLETLLRQDDRRLDARSSLGMVWNSRGMALQALKRPEEAWRAFEEAIVHQKQAFEKAREVADYRRFLGFHYTNAAQALRGLGRPAEAAERALRRKDLAAGNFNEIYNAACDLALCIPLVGKGKPPLSPQEQEECRRYAGWGIVALHEAVKAGYRDFDHMEKDPDLAPLREDPEFKNRLPKRPAKK